MNTTTTNPSPEIRRLITKTDFLDAIDEAINRRNEKLSEITRLTLATFDEASILRLAYEAQDAYYDMRLLKTQMRELFPTRCTCTCQNHSQEN